MVQKELARDPPSTYKQKRPLMPEEIRVKTAALQEYQSLVSERAAKRAKMAVDAAAEEGHGMDEDLRIAQGSLKKAERHLAAVGKQRRRQARQRRRGRGGAYARR